MRLFTVSPVEMYPDVLEVSGIQLLYFRIGDFSKIVLESESLLKKFARADVDAEVEYSEDHMCTIGSAGE